MEQPHTTLYAWLIAHMPLKGITVVKGYAYDRDFIDVAERKVSVELHVDGRVFVDGRQIHNEDSRVAWVRSMGEALRRDGVKPELVVDPMTQKIGRLEGHALHVMFGEYGIKDHDMHASAVLGVKVTSFRELTREQAHILRMALIFKVAA